MGGLIAGALKGVFAIIFGLYANIIGTLAGIFLACAVSIFSWVTSPNFISLSYTRLDNPFINVGWTLTRDLTNIFFVIALVAIGLGTALRLTGYQAQKALPTLIGIALLINFTPVILGLIVDASNIAMNFFIGGGFSGGNSFVNLAFGQWSNILSLVGGAKFWDPTASNEAMSAAMGSGVLIYFDVFAGMIYLLFAFLFIVRYIAIWTLVILSPFAFACYVLPATKNIFSLWWKQFLQWSILGVIAAFFLYLGDHLIRTIVTGGLKTVSPSQISVAPGLSSLMNSILPYGIALVFLMIGLIMSITFSPQGASAIMRAGEKGIKKTMSATGHFAAGAVRGIPAVSKAESAARRRLENMPVFGRALGGPGAFKTGLDSERKLAGKNLESMTADEIRKVMSMPAATRSDRLRRARGFEVLSEKGWLDDTKDKKYVPDALAFGVKESDVYGKMPHWEGTPDKIYQRLSKMDVEEFRKNISVQALKNTDVFEALDMSKIKDLGEKGAKIKRDALYKTVRNNLGTLNTRISALRATGNSDDAALAKRIEDMGNHIISSPNYT